MPCRNAAHRSEYRHAPTKTISLAVADRRAGRGRVAAPLCRRLAIGGEPDGAGPRGRPAARRVPGADWRANSHPAVRVPDLRLAVRLRVVHRQFPERRHLSRSARDVLVGFVPLSVVLRPDSGAGQRARLRLAGAARPLPHVPVADLAALPAGRTGRRAGGADPEHAGNPVCGTEFARSGRADVCGAECQLVGESSPLGSDRHVRLAQRPGVRASELGADPA